MLHWFIMFSMRFIVFTLLIQFSLGAPVPVPPVVPAVHVHGEPPSTLRSRLESVLRPGSPPQDKCTTIAVGRDATADGSTMATHTVDCFDCDWRVNKVPARDHPEGAERPVYLLSSGYPRQVRDDRGETWSESNLDDGEPLGHIVLGGDGMETVSVHGREQQESPIENPRKEWQAQKGRVILGSIPQVMQSHCSLLAIYSVSHGMFHCCTHTHIFLCL